MRPDQHIDQTFNDPQVQHLGIARALDHPTLGPVKVVGQAINMTTTPQPAKLRRHTPDLGEHTDEVLRDIATMPARSPICGPAASSNSNGVTSMIKLDTDKMIAETDGRDRLG